MFKWRGVQHIPIVGDAEDIQVVRPQFWAQAPHMPDKGTARITAGGTHAETGLQEAKGQMAFVLSQQAHQERVLARRAVHESSIDDEQAIGITVLDDVSIKERPVLELERLFIAFTLGRLSL